MNLKLKTICLALIFLSLVRTNSNGQGMQEDTTHLDLEDTGMMIENVISMNLLEIEYNNLQSTTGEKVELRARQIVINGDTVKTEEIKTRGQSTLMFKRKSLSIKLKSKARFRHGDKDESLKEFYLLNLSMDKYYCRNRVAFEMMDTLGIFHLFYSYGELKINGRTEGICMILERPEDWALKHKKSPVIIRRGYDHKIDKIKADNKTDRKDAKVYLNNYKQIYKDLGDYEGEELYSALMEHIDIDYYMKWLAFNYLVHNGDYSDEVFFYIDPKIKKFRIIPWDYDDIFAANPHEGVKQRNKIIGDKMIFSSEDLLDKKIANDPYLYKIYLERLKEVLETLTPDVLKQVIENTYAELYPYYSNKEIISNVQFDYYKDADMKNLKIYLSRIYLILNDFRNSYLHDLSRQGS